MNLQKLTRVDRYEWRIEPRGAMRGPGVIFADQDLIEAMDDKVFEQVANVASLPGIVKASYAMPDAHWGYGFPIGGVAAFDPVIVSARDEVLPSLFRPRRSFVSTVIDIHDAPRLARSHHPEKVIPAPSYPAAGRASLRRTVRRTRAGRAK
jgi:hypothetical protein